MKRLLVLPLLLCSSSLLAKEIYNPRLPAHDIGRCSALAEHTSSKNYDVIMAKIEAKRQMGRLGQDHYDQAYYAYGQTDAAFKATRHNAEEFFKSSCMKRAPKETKSNNSFTWDWSVRSYRDKDNYLTLRAAVDFSGKHCYNGIRKPNMLTLKRWSQSIDLKDVTKEEYASYKRWLTQQARKHGVGAVCEEIKPKVKSFILE